VIRKILLVAVFLNVFSNVPIWADEIDFVVLNMKDVKKTERQWKPLSKYLEDRIDQKVNFETLINSNFTLRSKGKDLLLVNPLMAVIIEDKGEFEIILTLCHTTQGASFAGLIIVHKDSTINQLKELAGKKVGVVNKKTAAGGFLFQANELLNAGLVPERDFSNFIEMYNQRAIVRRVIENKLDAGFIRTGMLESLKDSEDVSQVRILNRMDEGVAYPRSTSTYPNWAVLINRKVSSEIKEKIIKCLLEIKPDSEVAKSGKMKGFVPATDYSKMKNIWKRMNAYDSKSRK
jgi:two-component system, LuxR family, sensor histidine kinase TtrS